MIKQIILVVVLLLVAMGLYSLSKAISTKNQPEIPMEVPQTKLPGGSNPPGEISAIENVTWIWTETIANGDTSIIPKRPGTFTLTLKKDNTFNINTDCNTTGGTYAIASDGIINFKLGPTTTMFCEGSQEVEFTGLIELTSNYTLNNGNLVLFQKDSSVTTFIKKSSQDVTLSVGEKKTVDTLSITFNKLVQDSRCPIDVQCIQAGSVTINATLVDGTKTETKDFSSDKGAVVFGTHTISIKNVMPAPESKKTIVPGDYKITFHIE